MSKSAETAAAVGAEDGEGGEGEVTKKAKIRRRFSKQ